MSDEGRPDRPAGSPTAAIARGMGTVFRQIFRRDVTEEYPKEIEPPPSSQLVSAAGSTRRGGG